MFVILIYDVNVKRVNKVHKICRKYLNWVQLSVFEGELTAAQLEKLKAELSNVLKYEEDSLVIYKFRSKKYFSREIIGLDKGEADKLIY